MLLSLPWRRAALVGLLLTASAAWPPARAGSVPPPPAWTAPLGVDAPGVGTIRRFDGQGMTPAALIEALSRADFVLLGEKHDNADHHRLQAWIVDQLVGAGRKPAVAFEMMGADQATSLATFLATPKPDPAALGEAVGWAARGWPPWSLYQPIAEAALRAGLPLVAGDLARPMQRTISREGVAALDAATAARLGLADAFPPDLAASLAEELTASHCGHLPAAALPRMIDVQRARDASLAIALIEAAARPGSDSAVLIAGAGHTRRDRGVPWHLRRLAPGQTVFAVALIEVGKTNDNAAGATDLPFDYVWLTPRVDDADPCEKFGGQLQRLRPP